MSSRDRIIDAEFTVIEPKSPLALEAPINEFERMRRRALADVEQNGGWVMKAPPRPKPPRRPRWG